MIDLTILKDVKPTTNTYIVASILKNMGGDSIIKVVASRPGFPLTLVVIFNKDVKPTKSQRKTIYNIWDFFTQISHRDNPGSVEFIDGETGEEI